MIHWHVPCATFRQVLDFEPSEGDLDIDTAAANAAAASLTFTTGGGCEKDNESEQHIYQVLSCHTFLPPLFT